MTRSRLLGMAMIVWSCGTWLPSVSAQETPTSRPRPAASTAGRNVRRPDVTVGAFMGLNVHTVRFKPDLFAPVVRVLRNYHPVFWDMEKDSSALPPLPRAKNGVHWDELYGGWRQAGYRTHVSWMFDKAGPDDWQDMVRDAGQYAGAMVSRYGSRGMNLWDAVEIGNEPGHYDDTQYLELFNAMSKAVRAADPKMRIATSNVWVKPSNRYYRNIEVYKSVLSHVDIFSVHLYAHAEEWPTWRRTFPEDPAGGFLEGYRDVAAWRNRHAPGKPIWVTEFGWDAWSGKGERTKGFEKWETSTEIEQAAYLVRAITLLMNEGAERSHIYFFDDHDEGQLHGSSGLTRRDEPKPAFYAVAQVLRLLGPAVLVGLRTEGDLYHATFRLPNGKRIHQLWRARPADAPSEPARVAVKLAREAVGMAVSKNDPAPPVTIKRLGGLVELPVGPLPVYLSE